jgi:hypothetical protein
VAAATVRLGAQQAPRDFHPAAIPHVASFADLRPRTAAERAFADGAQWNGPHLEPEGKSSVARMNEDAAFEPDLWPNDTDFNRLTNLLCHHIAAFVGTITTRRVMTNQQENILLTVGTVNVESWIDPPSGARQVLMGRGGGKVYIGSELYSWPGGGLPEYPRGLFLVFPRSETTFALDEGFMIADSRLTVAGVSGTVPALVDMMRAATAGTRCTQGPPRNR